MDNSLLAVRDINHKYIVVGGNDECEIKKVDSSFTERMPGSGQYNNCVWRACTAGSGSRGEDTDKQADIDRKNRMKVSGR